MARATLKQMIAEIQRMPDLENLSLGEIADALNTASKDVGNQPWPWNYSETNVLVPAPYSTGTVNVTDGTNVVSLVGGTWASFVGQTPGLRIQLGGNNLDYIVSSVGNATTINLAQVVNLGANVVNGTYNLYRDTYQYPQDYIVGSDVALLQPVIRTRIPKIPRYKFEMLMNAGYRSFSTNIQMFYCDQVSLSDAVYGSYYQFRLGPPPAGPAELRLCYHSMAPDLVVNSTLFSLIPDGYDEILTLMAASRLYDIHKLPGMSEGVKTIAAGKIKLLKKLVATQTIDDVPDAAYEVPDSSISQWGMMIGRMP